jgi:hypothetical protein
MTVTVTDHPPDVTRSDVGIVLVNRWYVGTPDRQRASADALVAQWEDTPWPDGFISATCLVSTDGDTVLTYAQWTDDDAHRELTRTQRSAPAGGDTGDAGSLLEPAEPVRYRLYRSVVSHGPPQTIGCIVIPTFDVDGPQRQRHIVHVVAGSTDTTAEPVAGLIGAHLHVSTDGTRVLNYAEWTDEDAHRRMVERDSTPDEDEWRNRITAGTPGVRFTGYKRYHLHHTVTRP